MKGAAEVEWLKPVALSLYAQACGWTLARAHARWGDPIAISVFLGKGDKFDEAVTDFSGPAPWLAKPALRGGVTYCCLASPMQAQFVPAGTLHRETYV